MSIKTLCKYVIGWEGFLYLYRIYDRDKLYQQAVHDSKKIINL